LEVSSASQDGEVIHAGFHAAVGAALDADASLSDPQIARRHSEKSGI
jgi:hypothetical protein